MADNSHIQWTDATWNTVTGCTRISEGCLNCYIDRQPPFRMAGRRFDSPDIGGTTGLILHEDRFMIPLHWRNPRNVFVNSLSDLFHDQVPDEHIAAVFASMAVARQHTYQILTKRPARMRSLLTSPGFRELCEQAEARLMNDEASPIPEYRRRAWRKQWWSNFAEPLPNVHLGVSVESQTWADIRIQQLIDTPAAVRFLSIEPLLGPIDLHGPIHTEGRLRGSRTKLTYWLTGRPHWGPDQVDERGRVFQSLVVDPHIDWVIVGGESQHGARRMDLDWARYLVAQCRSAGVPVFVKQLGSVWARENGAAHLKGGDPAEWPGDLRVREFPGDASGGLQVVTGGEGSACP